MIEIKGKNKRVASRFGVTDFVDNQGVGIVQLKLAVVGEKSELCKQEAR